jgi:tripartite-type tricarboxylate transporter receptor subunit TctC
MHFPKVNGRCPVACGLVALLMVFMGIGDAIAQSDYPNRQIEFIIPFPPGGPLDTAARIIQPAMSASLGVPVVLVNKPGGGGALGNDFVAKAKPDGHTVAVSVVSALTILPATRPDLPYKVTDLVPVGNAASDLGVVTVRSNAPWKTLEEIVEDAKKNPGKLTYGSAGVGTVSFFMMELFKLSYGVDIAHVPFSGSGPVKNAILGGHVHLASSGFSTMAPLIRAGDLVPLVTTSPARVAAFPNVPTMAEKGFPEASINISIGMYVPAKTPKAVIAKLMRTLETVMKDPSVVAAIEKTGMVVDFRAPEALQRFIDTEREAVVKVVKKTGIAK